MKEPYRVLSLFAGIGGFDLGLERTGGFKTVAVSEIDKFGSRILAERFPDAVNIGDITKADFPDADFICAGFPCQDISFAGAGAGLAGERSGLWREVVRALRVVRPRGALLENVAALLSRGMDRVLGDMAEIGYDAEWKPTSEALPQETYLVGHEDYRGWFRIATLNLLDGWMDESKGGYSFRLDKEPTHFRPLSAPPRTLHNKIKEVLE